MKKAFLFFWLMLPLIWAWVHYSYGREWLLQDRAIELLNVATEKESAGDYKAALEVYDEVDELLEKSESHRLKTSVSLARVRHYLNNKQVVAAAEEAEKLQNKIYDDELNLNHEDQQKVRQSLAHSLYYTAWHMRLEGSAKEYWMKELEGARQHFKYLGKSDNQMLYNLQAILAMAKLGRKDLRLKSLPKENSGRGSQGVGEGRGAQQEGQGQGEGQEGFGEGEGQEDARGAGLGERPEGTGS